MGTLGRKAVWGAALALWVMIPAASTSAASGSGKVDKVLREGVLRKSFLREGVYHDQVIWSICQDDWREWQSAPAVRHTDTKQPCERRKGPPGNWWALFRLAGSRVRGFAVRGLPAVAGARRRFAGRRAVARGAEGGIPSPDAISTVRAGGVAGL